MLRKPPSLRNVGVDLDYGALRGFASAYQLSRVELVCFDAAKYLQLFDFSGAGRVLIYADPPYLPGTRSSAARYRHEYTVNQHRELIAVLRSVPASVMISGYPWRSVTFQVMTRGGVRTEQLWMNYPEAY